MKKILILMVMIVVSLSAETLFEVKDAQDSTVFSISNDGMRVINDGDTMMVISTSEARINLDNSKDRALSRSFSVSTTTNGKAGLANVLEVTTDQTTMREGAAGDQYTNFSPENIFIGLNSGSSISSGTSNVFLGNQSGMNNSSGTYNLMIGEKAGLNNDTGGNNMFIGNNSGETNISGSWNLFIGHGSGNSNTATNNMFLGHNAGYTNDDGESNLFVGTDAGAYNSSGTGNVFVGQQTGIYNTSGDNNTFVGRWAGNSNQLSSSDNTMIGFSTGLSQTTGNQNTYIGSGSGKSKTSGYYNTFVGFGAGENGGTGGYSSLFGYHAGYYNTGNYNTFLGMQAGYNNTGSSNVFIGNRAGYNEAGSDKLYIDNSDTASPLIYGDFSSNALTINGTLGVTGNASVGGTFTSSGNAFFNGTSLQIVTNPGSGVDPTNYVYQGSGLQSTSKQYAFAVNDALWVTSNAYIDGTASITGNTSLSSLSTSGDVSIGGGLTFNSTVFSINNSYNKPIIQGGWSSPWGDFTAINSSYEWQDTREPGSMITSNNFPLIVTSGNAGTAFTYTYMSVKNDGEIKMPYVYGDIVGATRRDLYIDNTGKLGYISSSKRYKTNITDMEDVSWLFKLRPVNYTYKKDKKNKKEYGLIAEEVEVQNNSFVSYNSEGDVETVNYSELITPMLKALQDQQKEIELLKKEIKELKNK